jgi:hypothetical protein
VRWPFLGSRYGHPLGERQQFDSEVVENALEKGRKSFSFKAVIEDLPWKV